MSLIGCFLATQHVRPLDFFRDIEGNTVDVKAKPATLRKKVENINETLQAREAQLVDLQAKLHERPVKRQAQEAWRLTHLEVIDGDFVMVQNVTTAAKAQ